MCAGICKLRILYKVYVRSISRVPAAKPAGFWTYAEKRLPASFSIWTTIWLQPGLKIFRSPGSALRKISGCWNEENRAVPSHK